MDSPEPIYTQPPLTHAVAAYIPEFVPKGAYFHHDDRVDAGGGRGRGGLRRRGGSGSGGGRLSSIVVPNARGEQKGPPPFDASPRWSHDRFSERAGGAPPARQSQDLRLQQHEESWQQQQQPDAEQSLSHSYDHMQHQHARRGGRGGVRVTAHTTFPPALTRYKTMGAHMDRESFERESFEHFPPLPCQQQQSQSTTPTRPVRPPMQARSFSAALTHAFDSSCSTSPPVDGQQHVPANNHSRSFQYLTPYPSSSHGSGSGGSQLQVTVVESMSSPPPPVDPHTVAALTTLKPTRKPRPHVLRAGANPFVMQEPMGQQQQMHQMPLSADPAAMLLPPQPPSPLDAQSYAFLQQMQQPTPQQYMHAQQLQQPPMFMQPVASHSPLQYAQQAALTAPHMHMQQSGSGDGNGGNSAAAFHSFMQHLQQQPPLQPQLNQQQMHSQQQYSYQQQPQFPSQQQHSSQYLTPFGLQSHQLPPPPQQPPQQLQPPPYLQLLQQPLPSSTAQLQAELELLKMQLAVETAQTQQILNPQQQEFLMQQLHSMQQQHMQHMQTQQQMPEQQQPEMPQQQQQQ